MGCSLLFTLLDLEHGWTQAKGRILAKKKSLSRFEGWFGKFFILSLILI